MAPGVRQRHVFYVKKHQKKNDIKKISKTDEPSDIRLIYPGGDTSFKLLLSTRFFSAMWSHITDCDETYNYWEPSHYLLYGNGQQTWEYSPQYALRSYTYLLIHLVPAKLYHYLLEPNPVLVFYFLRCLLSVGCALSEVYFYKNVCREFGVHIARMTLVFLLISPGMYISSAAFLPSSFSMYLSTVAISAWYARKYELAIFATAVSALLGWPFAALLGLPIAIEMLVHRREWPKFVKWTSLSAMVLLLPMVWIDSVHFGKLVIAPFNIVMYNIFTNHGPNIYGTAPFTFYFVNGFLNFNFVYIGALLAPVLLICVWALVPAKPRYNLCLPYTYSLAPLFIWILVFYIQPHKEERFLFPIYPMICLAGAISLDSLQKLYFFFRTKIKPLSDHERNTHYLQFTSHITFLTIFICGIFGLSRSFALYRGYYAPMEVMMEANKLGMESLFPKDVNINFCVGKEWYRFPTSFFFPSNNWKLQYLKSEFKGQLPQAFLDHENATSIIQPHFNAVNQEEPSRYFDVERCHFILDLDLGTESELEPNYSHQPDNFQVIKSVEFLDAANSHWFFRAFYIPLAPKKMCTYGSYNLLQSTKFKLTSSAKLKPTKVI